MAIALPPIASTVTLRPNSVAMKRRHYVPDNSPIWDALYETLRTSGYFQVPVKGGLRTIDPHFGRFGFRFQPGGNTPRYFHIGLDIHGTRRKHVYPVTDGILQYAGYGPVNGRYVFLSHPDIVTEDGFVLHSLYMHLSRIHVSFTSYQKMLREISFHTYPNVYVPKSKSIGKLGASGFKNSAPPHVHIQLEFRRGETFIAIDPLRLFRTGTRENLTASHEDAGAFFEYYDTHQKQMKHWKGVFKRR